MTAAGPPWDTSTYEGYKAFLEHCRNPPAMVAEILSTYFPDGPTRAAPEPDPPPPAAVPRARRRPRATPPGEQLALSWPDPAAPNA